MHSDLERRAGRAAGESAVVRVLVLGPLVIEHGGRTIHVAGTHRRRLLAFLASRRGQVVGVDVIVDALWGDVPPPSAAKTVQSHVARLRASLAAVGRDLIETTPGGYRLALIDVEVDADTFERRAIDGHRRLAAGDLTGAIAVLSDALAEWRGLPYTDFPDVEFAASERTRLDDIRAVALEDLAEARVESGAATVVTAELERLIGAHPGRERAWGLLMRALYADGRQQEALVAFQRARRVLAESFGLEPGPELRAMERRVLDQDPTLAIVQRSDVPAPLRTGTDELVGRAAEQAWLIEAWETARSGRGQLRIVLGPPESGRTRLAAHIAGVAAGDHAAVLYALGADDVMSSWSGDNDRPTPAMVVDAVAERSRHQPVLLVVDDVEWASATTMEMLAALAVAVEELPVLLLVVADPAGGGPAVQALGRIDSSGGCTHTLAPIADDDIARLVAADGIHDPAAVAAIVSVAGGRPGVARRESAAWAERDAGDRLNRAAAMSAGAVAIADDARDSVVEEVARLVQARARRHRLTSVAWLGRQPYRGLVAYGSADAEMFVGRERLVAELAARVLDRRLVIVTGASGSGKSSLVRAGLVPLVQGGRLPGGQPWRVNVAVPGESPLRVVDALADLDEPGAQLLVVDQFEEAFASGPTVVDELVGRLIDLALDPALDAHIVLVIRADQYGNLTDARHLTELIDDAHVLVGPPSDDELRRIVEEPALRAGCRVERALTSIVLDEAGHADGSLPLVSTALAELWEARDGDLLTAERYHALGGLAASVERLGAAVLERGGAGFTADNIRLALLLLADVTDDGSWVRQRIHRDDLPPDLEPAFDALVDGRLVVRDGDTVEIAHEIVFRAWPQLHVWLEDARTDLVLGRDLRLAARSWDDQGRRDDDVYRGARLAASVEWCQRQPESTTTQITDFVAAGTTVADHDRLAAEAQLASERRARRRLRRAFTAACLLLVVSLVAAGLAVAARRRADHERDRASAARVEAERQHDDAQVARLIEGSARAAPRQLDLALLLAVEARRHRDSSDTSGALLTALGHAVADAPPSGPVGEPLPSSLVGFIATGLDRAVDVDLSVDGRIGAVAGVGRATAGAVAIHDVRSRTELLLVELDYVPLIDLADDGRLALVWGDGDAAIYDVSEPTAVPVARRPPGGPAISGASLSPDASMAAVLWSDGSTTFHDTATGDRLERASPPRHDGIGGFLPDGKLSLLVAGDDWAQLVLWDVASGQSVGLVALEQPPAQFAPRTYTVSPDRALLVGTSHGSDEHGGWMDVWDLGSGRLLDEPSRPRARGRAVFVSERVIAFGRADGVLTFYDLATERTLRAPVQAHRGVIRDVWATRDGDIVVSIADDGLIAEWGPDDRSLIDQPILPDRRLGAISADGSTLGVLTPDGRAEVLALDGSSTPVAIEIPAGKALALPHQSLALSADGARILVLNQDGEAGRAFVADTHTGETVWVNETGQVELYIENGDISPDGTRVFLELYWGSKLQSVDVATGEVVAQVDADAPGLGDGTFWTVEVTPDGRFVDIVHGSAVARFDADTLELITTVEVGELAHSPVGALAHVPGSNDVLAAGLGGQIHRIDMTSGEVTTGQSRDTTSLGQISINADRSVIAATQFFTSAIALFDDTLAPIGDPLPALGFGPWWFTTDGDLIGSAALGIVQRELDPDEWQAIACRAAGRNLTRGEWAEYLGDEPYRATCPEWPPTPA